MGNAVVHLTGRLGGDPSGSSKKELDVISFSLAVDLWRGGKKHLVWWECSVWGGMFANKMRYLSKGKAVNVVGEITEVKPYMTSSNALAMKLHLNVLFLSFADSLKKSEASENMESAHDNDNDNDNELSAVAIGAKDQKDDSNWQIMDEETVPF